MKTKASLFIVILLLLFFSNQTFAFKCGSSIVKLGDRRYNVLDACGEPDFLDYYDRGLGYYYPNQLIHVEVWTYNFGKRKFMQELIFENGKLMKINKLDYGY